MRTEIRPGVERPDWSVVTSAAAREALLARDRSRPGPVAKWSTELRAPQDLAWRTVLQLFVTLGRPPRLSEIAATCRVSDDTARTLVSALQEHDLVGLDEASGSISYAYPFTARTTEHSVAIHRHQLHALCAIDALGVGAMYGTDVTIVSSCRQCGTPITIATNRKGTELGAIRPAAPVVWYDLGYERCAAMSCCPSIAFFCHEQHCDEWLGTLKAKPAGHGLTLSEAFEVGRALFGPILRAAALS